MLRILNISSDKFKNNPQVEIDSRIESLPINLIRPNPYQPRKSFSTQSLEELAQSIREYGIIQPITVRKAGLYGYELIAGERRLRASKLAGLSNIPSIIVNSYEKDSAMMAMIENLQREDLHFFEEAKGFESLIKDHKFTQEELAKKLGKSQSTVANKLRLLRLSESIKKMLLDGNLTERHARALLKLPDEEYQLKALNEILSRNLNVRDTEKLIEGYLGDIQEERVIENKTGIKKQKKLLVKSIDFRVFINTINKAVNMMRSYGLDAKLTQVEKADSVEIRVIIPKD